jgi:ribonucleoside-diphosphate reductase alpha chain
MSKRLSENAEIVLAERYYQPGEDWTTLTERVARFLDIDGKYSREFAEMIRELWFLPNSPTLMNAGTKLKNLSACFVLPIPDHMDGIFSILKTAALIQAGGGGTGFDLSELRPIGSVVSSTNGTTSGPISFLHVYDAASEVIKQGGKRRAANMAIMRADCRDVRQFIRCKSVEGEITNFNISIAALDKFMRAVELDDEWVLDYNLHGLEPVSLRARELMNLIVEGAWRNGEPGLFFIDIVNRLSTIDEWIAACNPCAEIGLPPYGSCNLGSINLSKFVADGKIDRSAIVQVVSLATRLLDNVVERNEYVLSEIEVSAKKYRPLGLGVMGWADMLLQLKVRYGSQESFEIAEDVATMILNEAHAESARLCVERGPNGEGKNRRNAMLTSVAPTGTLSLLAGCSSGIEPNFEWEYESHRVGRVLKHVHPLIASYVVAGEELPAYFVTTFDVTPEEHVLMQAVWQRHVDHSISKTINLPHSATRKDIYDAFMLAWKSGCKGITVYRDGSRQEQVLVSKTRQDIAGTQKIAPITRPGVLFGKTYQMTVSEKRAYITVNNINGTPIEVFLQPDVGGLGRLVSLALRSNISVDEVIEQLRKSQGSVELAIASALELSCKHTETAELCPVCRNKIHNSGGCKECPSCGWMACSVT